MSTNWCIRMYCRSCIGTILTIMEYHFKLFLLKYQSNDVGLFADVVRSGTFKAIR